MDTFCPYCDFYGSRVVNPSQRHLDTHPIIVEALPVDFYAMSDAD